MKENSPSKALRKIELEVKNHATINSIVMSMRKVQAVSKNSAQSLQTREVLYRGTPVLCLNFGEILEQRKAAEKEAQETERAKMLQKEERERARAGKRSIQAQKRH